MPDGYHPGIAISPLIFFQDYYKLTFHPVAHIYNYKIRYARITVFCLVSMNATGNQLLELKMSQRRLSKTRLAATMATRETTASKPKATPAKMDGQADEGRDFSGTHCCRGGSRKHNAVQRRRGCHRERRWILGVRFFFSKRQHEQALLGRAKLVRIWDFSGGVPILTWFC